MATHSVKNKTTAPQLTGDFQTDAKNLAADKKLTTQEKTALLDAFKKLDRSQQLQSIDFLKNESGVLANFAKNNPSFGVVSDKRVGGDRALADFKPLVGKVDQRTLIDEYRALSKSDQAKAVSDLRAEGQTTLATTLESSIQAPRLTKKQAAELGTKDLQAFNDAGAIFATSGKVKDKNAVIDIFRKLSEENKQAALDGIKNANPALASQLDRILNPRPFLPRPGTFGLLSETVI